MLLEGLKNHGVMLVDNGDELIWDGMGDWRENRGYWS
jgi:hypothetical protein